MKVSPIKILLVLVVVVFTSAIPISKSKNELFKEKVDRANELVAKASKDGKRLSSKELISIATELKGEKLSIKEKLALKLFNKKLTKEDIQSGNTATGKNQLVALLLVIFLGGIGAHRFYLGYNWQGVVQLLTLGGCGIWALIDLIRIITGDLTPKNGSYETVL